MIAAALANLKGLTLGALAAGILLIPLAGSCSSTSHPSGTCPTGQVRVDGLCVSTGMACGPGTTWVGDTCVAQACHDFAGFPCLIEDGALGVCVSGACIDRNSDSSNCGAYGYVCPPDSHCFSGACTFSDGGFAPCQSPYVAAANNQGNRPSCFLPTCTANENNQLCETPAGPSGFCCNGTCLPGDVQNCGGCGITCAASSVCIPYLGCQPSAACATSVLGSACNLPSGLLGGCCQGNCVDLTSDSSNCGNCGVVVPSGESCVDGASSKSCKQDAGCPSGSQCAPQYGKCLTTSCSASVQDDYCLADGVAGTCCGSTCAPLDSTCGYGPGCHMCDPGQVCNGASCVPGSQLPGLNDCQFGPTQRGGLCGTACVADWEDPQNCGACGNKCSSGICDPGTSSCLPQAPTDDCVASCGPNSVCVNGSCAGSDCTLDRLPFCLAEDGTIGLCCASGACAHPIDDVQNCGACGNACPAGQACVNGACSGFTGCGPGQMNGFCNLDAGAGHACCPSVGCTNLMTDSLNCGACGNACPGALTCVNGMCG